ncbi:MAG: hypothetical protein JRN55_02685 [Nitrososphaerota archaeon]|nr:hypothetical protein [Nitrososphaerota archaeon]
MPPIAPRRAGIVVFGARIASIFTGLLFIVMVTHTLSTSQFGLLEVVADLVAFSTYPLGAVNYWSSRQTARGETVGKTALLGSLLLTVVGIAVFSALAVVRQSAITGSLGLFVLALSLVPVNYFYSGVNSLLLAHDPEATGYVLLAGELSKLAVVYPLLFVFRVGIAGAFAALAVSNLVLGGAGLYYARGTMSGPPSVGRLKGWLRDAWLPAMNSAPYVVGIADTYIAFLISGTVLVGYYQAAFSVAMIVGYSSYLSYALYPLLLRGAGDRMIATLFDFMMLFGVPMAVGAAALAPELLYLLSKSYVGTAGPLVILAFSVLAGAVSTVLDRSLMGRERSDLAVEDRFKRLVRSNLFFVPVANLVYSAVYLSSVALIVYWGGVASASPETVIAYWAASQLVLTVILVAVKGRRLGAASFKGTLRPLAFYVGCALAMGASVRLLAPLLLPTPMPTIVFGLRLAVVVAVGGMVYFGALAAVDRGSRERFARVWDLLLP